MRIGWKETKRREGQRQKEMMEGKKVKEGKKERRGKERGGPRKEVMEGKRMSNDLILLERKEAPI